MNATTSSGASILLTHVAKYPRNFRTYLKTPNLVFVKVTFLQNLDSLGLKEQKEHKTKKKGKTYQILQFQKYVGRKNNAANNEDKKVSIFSKLSYSSVLVPLKLCI